MICGQVWMCWWTTRESWFLLILPLLVWRKWTGACRSEDFCYRLCLWLNSDKPKERIETEPGGDPPPQHHQRKHCQCLQHFWSQVFPDNSPISSTSRAHLGARLFIKKQKVVNLWYEGPTLVPWLTRCPRQRWISSPAVLLLRCLSLEVNHNQRWKSPLDIVLALYLEFV